MFSLDENIWAHTAKNKEPETLQAHSDLTKKYLQDIKDAKNLDGLIANLADYILEDEIVLRIFDELIIWHDIGKINPAFQTLKMKNPAFKVTNIPTTHSDRSFKELKNAYEKEIFEIAKDMAGEEAAYKIVNILYFLLSNVLSHHGSLKDGFDMTILCENRLDNAFLSSLEIVKFDIRFFIFIKLHFSLLIASDFYATSEYMNDIKTTNFGVFDKNKKRAILHKFKDFYTSLKSTKKIDKLRSEIFKTAQENLDVNKDKNIFYLEAPTGSGKTLTSLNLALNLLNLDSNLNKIFYIFPFNTLISQSKAVFDSIFADELETCVINSITSPDLKDYEQENIESNYDKTYINRLFFNHPFILTSHVGLFKILFGTTKEENYPLFALSNSVIILDEIQSYSPNLWEFMAFLFDNFAKALNIKFIIMSATLPKVSTMLDGEDGWCDLLPNSKEIFQNPLFKDRVTVDFSLLDRPKDELFYELVAKAKKHNTDKILFEFITKKSARKFYDFILDKFVGYEIFELSGDDNKLYQKSIIKKIKTQGAKLILVATQIIEAGVDIDMDLGFKDIATIESEEQFMGRVNRSALKNRAIVYFFDYDDQSRVYKDDERVKFSLKNDALRESFKEKNFKPYYEMLLKELYIKNSSTKNSLKSIRQSFFDDIEKLNYKIISSKMKLIKDDKVRVFLPFLLDISEFDMSEYGQIDEFMTVNLLDGKKIWNAIVSLNEVQNYSKRKLEALKLNALAGIFSFNVYGYKTLPEITYGFSYIDDFDGLVDENGKFNRDEFEKRFNNQEMII